MNKSKYSKFLTIFLIVLVIIIIGLLIFWGVDAITKYRIENDADAAIEAFKNNPQNKSGITGISTIGNGNSGIISPSTNTNSNSADINPSFSNLISDEELLGLLDDSSDSGSPTTTAKYKGFPMSGYIEIPATNVKLPILDEATKDAMEKSVCILTGVGLNRPGVTVISGHNYRNNSFFSNNIKINKGDVIYITDGNKNTVTYVVYKKYQTTPEDAAYTTTDTQGKREVVLTTCTDDSQNRIIICAREK